MLGCIDPEYSLILDAMRGKVKDKGKTIKEGRNPVGLDSVTQYYGNRIKNVLVAKHCLVKSTL